MIEISEEESNNNIYCQQPIGGFSFPDSGYTSKSVFHQFVNMFVTVIAFVQVRDAFTREYLVISLAACMNNGVGVAFATYHTVLEINTISPEKGRWADVFGTSLRDSGSHC